MLLNVPNSRPTSEYSLRSMNMQFDTAQNIIDELCSIGSMTDETLKIDSIKLLCTLLVKSGNSNVMSAFVKAIETQIGRNQFDLGALPTEYSAIVKAMVRDEQRNSPQKSTEALWREFAGVLEKLYKIDRSASPPNTASRQHITTLVRTMWPFLSAGASGNGYLPASQLLHYFTGHAMPDGINKTMGAFGFIVWFMTFQTASLPVDRHGNLAYPGHRQMLMSIISAMPSAIFCRANAQVLFGMPALVNAAAACSLIVNTVLYMPGGGYLQGVVSALSAKYAVQSPAENRWTSVYLVSMVLLTLGSLLAYEVAPEELLVESAGQSGWIYRVFFHLMSLFMNLYPFMWLLGSNIFTLTQIPYHIKQLSDEFKGRARTAILPSFSMLLGYFCMILFTIEAMQTLGMGNSKKSPWAHENLAMTLYAFLSNVPGSLPTYWDIGVVMQKQLQDGFVTLQNKLKRYRQSRNHTNDENLSPFSSNYNQWIL